MAQDTLVFCAMKGGVAALALALLTTAVLQVGIDYLTPHTVPHGTRVIVCGASTGIGQQIALDYARRGASVFSVIIPRLLPSYIHLYPDRLC